MSKHGWMIAAWFVAAPLLAADMVTLESCIDHRGRTVATIADYQQGVLVQSTVEGGPVIRYNPGALPQLSAGVREFFFAHECARHALGTAGRPAASAAEAGKADCVGLHALLDAGLLAGSAVADLQRQLVFTQAEWALLPGPSRSFDLAACPRRGNVLKMPAATPPSARQADWNACAHACADRLWSCMKKCHGTVCEQCEAPHAACQAVCGAAPEK